MKEMKQDRLAFDRATARSFDADGHLRVLGSNITKANICDYRAEEIPDWETHGLKPGSIYKLFRDPEELEKAVKSFDGKPLLFTHKATTAADHDHDNVVGSINNPVWAAPYIKAQLSVWTDEAIKAIESGAQKELSSAYRYRYDPTPGTFEGQRFDGSMRDIEANHVALVAEGRAGSDVVVGDSMENLFMNTKTVALSRAGLLAQGALSVFLAPKLAMDAKVDFSTILGSVKAKDFASRKPAIAADIMRKTAGKLAKDEQIDTADLAKVLDAVAGMMPTDPVAIADMDDDNAMDSDDTDLKAMLKAKGYSDDEIEKICAKTMMASTAADTDDDAEKKKLADEIKAKDAEMKDMVKKPAMDAACAKARADGAADAIKIANGIRDAERIVRPWVGDLAMSFDSAEGVYRGALKVLGNKRADTAHADALVDIINTHPKPGDRPARAAASHVAMDEAARGEYDTMLPDANRLSN